MDDNAFGIFGFKFESVVSGATVLVRVGAQFFLLPWRKLKVTFTSKAKE